MLILGIKPGQGFTVGDNIEVKILEIVNRGLVRVGIEAPPEVKVLRGGLVKKDSEASRSNEKGSP